MNPREMGNILKPQKLKQHSFGHLLNFNAVVWLAGPCPPGQEDSSSKVAAFI